ncbi:WD40-repeat-containing domain protein [Mucor mucedo]|uniref:WD40-repeat-containing domain protein n=1 Tax=Mucor mucedo TaxID=29922 RepID=UPI00221EEB22|nr:WD40-repeat-containing domain protein [Mucor mucedo]KAI7896218.1 WD40-repeat-containing domain protein [Mucor mucedo]
MGLKKKTPQYTTTVLEEQPQLSDEEEEDDDEEESCSSISSVEEDIAPPVSISSAPTVISHHDGKYIKTKTKHKKYSQEFARLMLAQTINTSYNEQTDHQHRRMSSDSSAEPNPNHPYGAIWALRFSKDGKYLASAGQSCVVLLWKLLLNGEESIKVLDEAPHMEYKGHTADILDLAWSKNNFLLSSSMDNTVRLWHTTQKDCLCVFQHLNFVTAIDFHPKDDRFFLSGSMDGRIRIWSIPEKRVAFWNEIPDNKLATAVAFTLDGKTVIAGSHDGHCYFFETQSLKYNTQISVMNDTSSNRNASSKKGPKITGIEVMPGLPPGDEKILITSNDSRATFSDDGRYIISGSEDCHTYIWRTEQSSVNSPLHHLQETRNKAMSALGHVGESTLSGFGSFDSPSPQQQTRISKWLKRRGGGDDHHHHASNKIRSRTEYFESHDHVVTSSIFAPTKTRQWVAKSRQDTIYNNTPINLRRMSTASSGGSLLFNEEEVYPDGHIIITADYRGLIKVWRIDSGSYTNHATIDTQTSLLSESATFKPSSPKVKRNFGGLFGARNNKN